MKVVVSEDRVEIRSDEGHLIQTVSSVEFKYNHADRGALRVPATDLGIKFGVLKLGRIINPLAIL